MGNSGLDRIKILEMIETHRLTAEQGYRLLKEFNRVQGGEPAYRAVIITRPSTIEDLETVSFHPPEPGDNEIQILVRAFSLNFADYLCVMGMYPNMPDYPFTPGIEVSGSVVKTGARVKRFREGDAVIGLMGPGLGGHRTIVNAHEQAVVLKPAGVSFEEACAFPAVFLTMYHIFETAMVEKGEKILIQTAAGGTGLVAVQLARLKGAEIFATAGSREKLDYLKTLGVHHTINYRTCDFASRVMEITGNYGVDVVINTLPGEAIQKGINILAPGGRYMEIAMTGLKSATNLDLSKMVNNQAFYSFDLGKFAKKHPGKVTEYLHKMVEFLENGTLKPTVCNVFPFSQVKQAYRCLEKRKNIGKVVVTIPQPAGELKEQPGKIKVTPGPGIRQTEGDIGIIGMSGRFPGAKDVDRFWKNLAAGKSAVIEVPGERWDISTYYDPDRKKIDKTDCKWGGFLEDIDAFDPLFFHWSGKEAELTDPQQRLLLEEGWKALEDAGYTGPSISGKKCGIFVGTAVGDYTKNKEGNAAMQAYSWLGNTTSITPARISYFLDLKGPAVALDTACSSSLVAIHLARQSILSGDCDMALAGGVFISTTPAFHILASNAGMLSPTGKCKTFDDEADGFVPGEGVGVVVLKSLASALKDGDHIYAVIKASCINQDGRSNGITAPSPLSQTELELSLYEKFNLNPETITYVETHGTATRLGDPIEIEALTNSFKKYTKKKQCCAVGSVKTNIGHAATAAGIASIIKVVLSLQHKQIPPSLHYHTPNRHINFEDSPFYVNTELKDWHTGGKPRRAAVSAFGFSGTNVHMVLEEARESTNTHASLYYTPPYYFIPLSAQTKTALEQKYKDLLSWIEPGTDQSIGNIAYTLLAGRQHFAIRSALITASIEDLKSKLEAIIQNHPPKDFYCSKEHPEERNEKEWQQLMAKIPAASTLTPAQYKDRLAALADFYIRGCDPDWTGLYPQGYQRISLPTYPFDIDKERYWAPGAPAASKEPRTRTKPHILIDSWETLKGKWLFKKVFTGEEFFIKDHGNMLPGVVYMEMVRAAAALANPNAPVRKLKNFIWPNPIMIHTAPKEVTITLYPDHTPGLLEFHVSTAEMGRDNQPVIHSRGMLQYEDDLGAGKEVEPGFIDIPAVLKRCQGGKSGADDYFRRVIENGGQLGHRFRGIQEFYYNQTEALTRVDILQEQEKELHSYGLHPTLTDAAFQSMAAFGLVTVLNPHHVYLPYVLKELEIMDTSSRVSYVYVRFAASTRGDQPGQKKFDALLLDETGRVLLKMKEFSLRPLTSTRGTENKQSTLEMLYYQMVWEESPWETRDLSAPHQKNIGRVLVFDMDSTLIDQLNQRFMGKEKKEMNRFILVKPGKRYRCIEDSVYEVNPGIGESYEQLATALKNRDLLPGKILHLWTQRDIPGEENRLKVQLEIGVYSLFHICRAFMKQKLEKTIQLLYFFSTSQDDLQPPYAAVSGFTRSLNQEGRKLICKVVETHSPAAPPSDLNPPLPLDIILHEMRDETANDVEVRYDGKQRSIKRLQEFDLASKTGPGPGNQGQLINENNTYLITGGLGRLGLIFARHLVTKAKVNLVLVDCTPLTAETTSIIRELEDSGAAVAYIDIDISVPQQVKTLVEQVKSKFGGIHGIFHCAGLNRDALLLNKTPAEMEQVLGPKVHGTVNLDVTSREENLDFFLLFSSTTAVLGYPGQSDYGFANCFMDHFAHQREKLRKQGKRTGKTLSVNWPSWEQGGMKMDKKTQELITETLGIKPIDTTSGIKTFEMGLLYPGPGFMVLGGNREKIRESINKQAGTGKSPGRNLREQFNKDFINMVSELLKIPVGKITLTQDMSHYGFDSIGFTDLSHQVNAVYRLGITPDIFFEHSNLGSVSSYLLDTYRDQLMEFYRERSGVPDKEVLPGLTVQSGISRKNAIPGNPPAAETNEPMVDIGMSAAVPQLENPDQKSSWPCPAEAAEPVVIIGMSGVMPQSDNLGDFWKQIIECKDLVTEIPPDRWDWREFYGDPAAGSHKTRVKWGGFIKDADKFDPLFFHITPWEAEFMDPQLRILLQTVWETIEDAGYKAADLSGTKTGVFVGTTNTDYVKLLERQNKNVLQLLFMISGRVSYVLNLRGPSETIDTACSSSLAAVHRAVAAIQRGNCSMAIAGGVNLIADPRIHILVSQNDSLSKKGRCFTFDKRADGYTRGEGAGALLLKPLSQAKRDRDHIYAVIRGSAVNHCGHTSSPTTPNPVAQADVIIEAMEKAKIDPTTISFIEAHGTGTTLGDPIEVNGLKRAFKHLYERWKQPYPGTCRCGLGTVKTSIGHLEPAAGIASLIKVLLSFKHGFIPGNIQFQEINPYIKLEDSPFYIVVDPIPWERSRDTQGCELPRRAGISSFGIGGTNVHLVLEEWLEPGESEGRRTSESVGQYPGRQEAGDGQYLILLSAKNEERLKVYADRMTRFLEEHEHPGQEKYTTPRELKNQVQKQLVKIVSELKAVVESDIRIDEDLEEYGFDVVKRGEFLDRLQEIYHLDIKPGILAEITSLEAFSDYLCREYMEVLEKYHHPGKETGRRDTLAAGIQSEPAGHGLDLADIAYTLQVGRSPMEERLAVIVSNTRELREKLVRYCRENTKTDIEKVYRGNIKTNKTIVQLVGEGREDKSFIELILNQRKPDKLAQLWTAGFEIDWARLYPRPGQTPKRVSLPTYPFARERYWAPALPRARGTAAETVPARESHLPQQPVPGHMDQLEQADLENPGALKDFAVNYLKGILSTMIKLEKDRIDPGAGFEDIGMDSIMVNRLNNTLKERFEDLPATLFFKYKNLESLAGYLVENHGETLRKVTTSSLVSGQEPVNPVETAEEQTSSEPSPPISMTGGREPRSVSDDEDIAIIGISGRYPMAVNLEEFWENLRTGRNCVVEIPPERWDYRRFFDPAPGKKEGMYCYWGGFLEDVDKFDPRFFNISPLEARFMDPQERLFLQTAWTCFEDAGYTRKTMENPNVGDRRGSVGVFVGITFNNYQLLAAPEFARGNMIPINSQMFSTANRISYIFNFSGPSIPVDTACSSSLYAVHLACESIKRQECEMALAGGVNLSIHPSKYVTLCQARVGSSVGHCDAFGEGSDGYVPAEGVGAVLLKPLGKAVKDRDYIYAKIKSTAVNHDGHTHGYSVPNPVAQAELIRTALEKARIHPETISYVEAHGTGTRLGDPIEIQGLTDAYRHYTGKTQFCSIGSVKSNIGHAEAAAGIAQVTKVVLQMKHETLAASLINSKHTNPNIDFIKTPFQVLRETREWKQPIVQENGKSRVLPRRAGISSFGVGGVNIHAILEEYREKPAKHPSELTVKQKNPLVVLPLSAKGEENLRTYAQNLGNFLEKNPGVGDGLTKLADIGHTLQVGREPMPFRLAVVARTPGEAVEKLKQFLNLENKPHAQFPGRIFYNHLQKETGKQSKNMNDSPQNPPLIKSFYEESPAGKTGDSPGKFPQAAQELAAAWVNGAAPDWEKLYVDEDDENRPRRVPLPTYPFSRERYWLTETTGFTVPVVPGKQETAPSLPGTTSSRSTGILEALAAASESERYPLIVSYLQKTIAELLEFPPPNLPDLHRGFFDMGMDSIMSTLLYTRIEKDLNLELYATATIDYPNAAELSRYLLEQVPFDQMHRLTPAARAETEPGENEKIYIQHLWEQEDIKEPAAAGALGNLLVFDTGHRLLEALGQEHIRPVLVKPGQDFHRVGEREYRVNPDSPGDFRRLVETLASHKQMPGQIIYAWSGEPFTSGEQALRQQLRPGIYSLFHLSRALLEQRPTKTVRLLYVYPGTRENPQPQHEAVRAFGRSISMENPKLIYGTAAVEVLRQQPQQAANILMREMQAGDEPGIAVCWEGNRRWVKRFREFNSQQIQQARTPRPGLLKENGVYLITGGAGGVGLIFARYIAQTVNANIVLTGRSELAPGKQQQLDNIREYGSRVVYIKADIGKRPQVENLAAETRKRFKRIDGIIHSAGLLRDSFLIKKTDGEIEDVFTPKVYGTLHLDEVFSQAPLDFFLMFSSMVAIFGNAGQCDYAYANHFIDGYAAVREQLRAQNKRKGKTTAINWTNWKEGGMKVEEKLLDVLAQRFGIVPINKQEGIEAFEIALQLNDTRLGFVKGQKEKMGKLMQILPARETGTAEPGQSEAGEVFVRAAEDLETPPHELHIPGDGELSEAVKKMTREQVKNELKSLLNGLGM